MSTWFPFPETQFLVCEKKDGHRSLDSAPWHQLAGSSSLLAKAAPGIQNSGHQLCQPLVAQLPLGVKSGKGVQVTDQKWQTGVAPLFGLEWTMHITSVAWGKAWE